MKKLLVGAAAFGCRRAPSGADKTEIPVDIEPRLRKVMGDHHLPTLRATLKPALEHEVMGGIT